MDSLHRGLYVRWCQSPRVELAVGEDLVSSDNLFVIPRDFLQRRSRTLRREIEKHESKIRIPDTTVPTMTEFFIWSHSRKPQLEDRLSFDEIVHLGIFAYKYEVAALSNQVTDLIRANLASAEWELQAGVVDAIYQAAPANSPLREVVKAALGKLPRSSIDGEDWESAFNNNSGLGWDCHKAGGKEWARQEYLSGVCRFHNHDGIKRQEGLCDGCPYAEADCYPEWDEDFKQEQETESPVEEVPPSPEPLTSFEVEEAPAEEAQVEEAPVDEAQTDEAPAEEYEAPVPEDLVIEEATAGPNEDLAVADNDLAVPEEPAAVFDEPAVPDEPAAVFDEPAVPDEPEAVFDEPAAPDEPAPWEPAFVVPDAEELEHPEEPAPEEVNGIEKPAKDVSDPGLNGHVESDELEEAPEEANGTETPHVKMTRGPSVSEEVRSESLYPESQSSDRENIIVPKLNGNVVQDKNRESVTVTAVPEPQSGKLSKKAKKKAKRALSISHAN